MNIPVPGIPQPLANYTPAVRAGHLVFTAGQLASDFKNGVAAEARIDPAFPYYGSAIKKQTRYVLENLAQPFKAAGTSLDHVVKAQVFHTDLINFNGFDEVWKEFFPTPPPRTTIKAVGRVMAMLILAVLWAGSVETADAPPVWKIERAEVERLSPATIQPRLAAERMLILKLGLRNDGGPGNLPVKILGRWVTQQPRPFTLLGTYTVEVAFKPAVRLEIQLFPLLVPPAHALGELSVVTGDQETDRQTIEIPE
ncbi:MAG TPA: RidA family protein [Acidimicrobiia bacterium]